MSVTGRMYLKKTCQGNICKNQHSLTYWEGQVLRGPKDPSSWREVHQSQVRFWDLATMSEDKELVTPILNWVIKLKHYQGLLHSHLVSEFASGTLPVNRPSKTAPQQEGVIPLLSAESFVLLDFCWVFTDTASVKHSKYNNY